MLFLVSHRQKEKGHLLSASPVGRAYVALPTFSVLFFLITVGRKEGGAAHPGELAEVDQEAPGAAASGQYQRRRAADFAMIR